MQKTEGFTLIELLVALSVAGIIMAIAIPAAQTMQANNRVSSLATDLATDLKKTRSEAVISRRNLNFKPNGSIWNYEGWNTSGSVNGEVKTILKKEAYSSTVIITEESSNYNIVFIGTTGMIDSATDIVFKICDSSITKEQGYNVLLNRFGRVAIQRHANATVCNP